jgi:UDP-N-acetylmuramate dehydrogenase
MTPPSAVEAAAEQLGPRARRDVPLGPMTTYRVGGPASLLVVVSSVDDLAAVRAAVVASGLPVLVVGKGSNLLVADAGFTGIAVVLGEEFAAVEVDGTRVRAGAAASLPVVARRTAAAGLTGFEWAVGVPGSIGGAVRMNAGGHGSDMTATLRSVDLVDLAEGFSGQQADHRRPAVPRTVAAAELALGYRRSAVGPTQLVLTAELELAPGDRSAAEAAIAEIVRWRRAHQPGGTNAGSVFTNPPGDSAGRLVEAAGAKGLRLGSAQVSPKHANFIQADEGGRAADVAELMAEVARRVREHSGVELVPETRMIGFGSPVGSAR